ncbi:subtype I-B CRISPR-associated endonuclease Cas1 [Eggerthia catenaformis]|uniref:type I-B CRISPR-associated endonuclease Cas1b n=1 Tax=Eggerthia catenaformis TaxID=31973 RepID=UPI00047B9CD0|nr:type I-B CRISPR-associated endonuclease Cas1b [Eggerthia catenaformis]OUC52418.1 subtype I-B CRISPR-associated endonuclease Cas1 [Eggerthia catenaformis]
MKNSLYIYQNGELKRNDNTLLFINDEGVKRAIPINNISEIYLFGENIINSKLVNFLSQNDVLLHFFNYYSYYTASLIPRKSKISGKLLVKQVSYYSNNTKRMKIAKQFVSSAANNIYRNLRYYNGRGKDVSVEMKEVQKLIKQIDACKEIHQLMGVEGNIHKIYYKAWNVLIDQEIDFIKRVKRPPDNMINTLISFINSLVYTTVLSEIYKTQLDPTISYLHEPGTSRFSLSLDISEIFKPLIADRLIFSLLNRNQIQEKHFTQGLEYLHLEEKGSKIVLSEFDKKLKQTIHHRDLDKDVSYRYLIRLECYKLIKHLYGEKEYESFVIWW